MVAQHAVQPPGAWQRRLCPVTPAFSPGHGVCAGVGGEEVATVISRGNAAAAAITGAGGAAGGGGSCADPADLAEVEAFEQLKVILDLLAASSRWVGGGWGWQGRAGFRQAGRQAGRGW